MAEELSLVLPPETAYDEAALRAFLISKTGRKEFGIRIVRRSVDARRLPIKVNVIVQLTDPGENAGEITPLKLQDVTRAREVLIAGCGPAGLFAALRLIEAGLRPVIIERGKEVSERKRDVAAISTKHIVEPDSNYCFGEGGAGTFSDGKLTSRTKNISLEKAFILESYIQAGAPPEIRYLAHPHLGKEDRSRAGKLDEEGYEE